MAELNNIKGSNLTVGTILRIPLKSGTNPDTMFMYTVKNGDTLYSIARKYNTTVDEIKKLNYLNSNNLSVGQVIRIPEMYTKEEDMNKPNYINYVVKAGDTFYNIAKNNGVSVDTIKKDNSITGNILPVGTVLKIRTFGNNEVNIEEECYGREYIPLEQNNTLVYTVKKGDSLYTISNKYNTSVDAIKSLNNLKNNNLSIGQVLKIPTSLEKNSYVVQKGDSLYSIAKKFNATIDSIKKKNNLNSNLLSVGQKLNI